jgi:hypothetical protein
MTPERRRTIGDQKIEEFYWAGSFPVYVNNRLSDLTYEAAVMAALRKTEANLP